MDTSKLVDDLVVNLNYQTDDSPRSCFIVFSSRERHVEVVIDCIETVFAKLNKFQVIRLDEHLKSGDSQYKELTDLLSTCSFAIVILDGFRPNVLFEYGVLKGLAKPCIVLLEEEATVDTRGFFPEGQASLPTNPSVNMDVHFSDVKDRFYVRYNKHKPKLIRAVLESEYSKLRKKIEEEFHHVLFPHRDFVQKELKPWLETIVRVFNMTDRSIDKSSLADVNAANSHIARIAKDHRVTLPTRYFWTLAYIYEHAREYSTAVAIIDSALTATAADVFLLSSKAQVLRKLGKFEDAIAVIDVAVAVDPNKEFLWHQKGLCFERLNQENEAQRCYEKAVQLDSTCSSLHFHYGLLLYQKDEFAAALREFDNALKAEPSEEDYLLWKARALHKTDSLDDARRIVNRLLTINEKNADAWFVLAQLAPDDSQQLPLFQKVLKLQPGHPGALCSSAACLSNLGNYEEALAIFRRMQEVCPRHQMCDILITNTCTTLAKLGRTEEGITQVEELLLIAPTHAGALSAKAICLTAAGKSSEAFSLYQHALTLHPNNTTLWYNQACLFASKRKVRESIRCLQKAISIDGSYLATMKADHDFDPIRNRKTFKVAFHHN